MTEAALQTKINNADSNTSMSELLNMMYSAKEYSYHSLYDSAGVLPAADSANIGRIAFAEANDGMYVFVGMDSGWQLIDSNAESPTAPSYTGRQGSNYGYTAAGRNPGAPGPTGAMYTIDKFSFSSDGDATDVGDVVTLTFTATGHSSATDGYAAGGGQPSYSDMIQKYPFASDGNATDIGYDLVVARRYSTSGAHSETHGYVTGGATGAAPPPNSVGTTDIEKFAFTNDANATDVGDLTVAKTYRAGQNSTTDGYASGGVDAPGTGFVNVIDKYPFSADTNSTDVGDITTGGPAGRYGGSGTSSTTHGYTAGGMAPPYTNIIDKFPFAADGNATDVGDIIATKRFGAGQTSTTHAYMSGGGAPYVDTIQKWSTSSDENASDIGNLTVARDLGAPAQY